MIRGRVWFGTARLGLARQGSAWWGEVWYGLGKTRWSYTIINGACPGEAEVRSGRARLGGVRRGVLEQDMDGLIIYTAWLGEAWLGMARRGGARSGLAKQGKNNAKKTTTESNLE